MILKAVIKKAIIAMNIAFDGTAKVGWFLLKLSNMAIPKIAINAIK
jgi:hypothetical protein